jgi:hypothetical protein
VYKRQALHAALHQIKGLCGLRFASVDDELDCLSHDAEGLNAWMRQKLSIEMRGAKGLLLGLAAGIAHTHACPCMNVRAPTQRANKKAANAA